MRVERRYVSMSAQLMAGVPLLLRFTGRRYTRDAVDVDSVHKHIIKRTTKKVEVNTTPYGIVKSLQRSHRLVFAPSTRGIIGGGICSGVAGKSEKGEYGSSLTDGEEEEDAGAGLDVDPLRLA
jgi:hypothetical protein